MILTTSFAATLRLDKLFQWVGDFDFDFDFASNISTAGDVEHCTKLEATLVESFPLIFMHLRRSYFDHFEKKDFNLVSLLDCPQTSRAVLQLWLLL